MKGRGGDGAPAVPAGAVTKASAYVPPHLRKEGEVFYRLTINWCILLLWRGNKSVKKSLEKTINWWFFSGSSKGALETTASAKPAMTENERKIMNLQKKVSNSDTILI